MFGMLESLAKAAFGVVTLPVAAVADIVTPELLRELLPPQIPNEFGHLLTADDIRRLS